MIVAKSVALVVAIVALLGALPARGASVLTFDNLGPPDGAVPNGYGGFDWGNFEFLDGVHFDEFNPSGYEAGVTSPNNVAFNSNADPAFLSITGGSQFNFIGAYLTAAWNDNLNVRIQGFSVAAPIYDTTVTLSATAPTFFALNYTGIDQLLFTSSGGTLHPGYSTGGQQFVMDDFTFTLVPEPSSLVLSGLAAVAIFGTGVCTRRRRATASR